MDIEVRFYLTEPVVQIAFLLHYLIFLYFVFFAYS